jgi:hypothetical protein
MQAAEPADAAAPEAALPPVEVVVQAQASKASDRADSDTTALMIFLSTLANIRS